MCGLIAYYKLSEKPLSARLIEDMTNAMAHRGPDDHGFCFVGSDGPKRWREGVEPPVIGGTGVALGHRRFSIFDLTTAGRQPFISADGRFSIVFNGEIYNFLELREELEKHGFTFSTDCDTEALLAAFEKWDTECFSRLNGAFAIVIWDNAEKRLVAARDRVGEKPLLYTRVDGDWVFASEVKGLIKHPEIKLEPNEQSVLNFIATGRSPKTGETFFDNVLSVEPGCVLTFKGAEPTKTRYFNLDTMEFAPPKSDAQAIEQLGELLTDSVKLRMRGDLRVGTMLSGGMDSTSVITSVVSVLASQSDESRSIGDVLQAFTASFPGTETDETDKVEELCQMIEIAAHKVFPIEQDALVERLGEVSTALEAPFWSPAIVTHDMLMKRIRNTDVDVVLDGLGSDEMLGGYDWYIPLAVRGDLLGLRFGKAMENLRGLQAHHGRKIWKEVVRALLPIRFPVQLDALKRRLSGKGAHWHSGMFGKELNRSDSLRHPSMGKTLLECKLKDAMLRDNVPRWLHMGDNISMSNSVVCRSPFLDYRLVEFAFSLGDGLRIRKGVTKYVLREAKREQLPASIVNSIQKVQLTGPGLQWLHGPLKEFALSIRDGKGIRLTEFIKPPALAGAMNDFYSTDRGYAYPIWRLLNTEAWLRAFF